MIESSVDGMGFARVVVKRNRPQVGYFLEVRMLDRLVAVIG